jgi:hypothetical protein
MTELHSSSQPLARVLTMLCHAGEVCRSRLCSETVSGKWVPAKSAKAEVSIKDADVPDTSVRSILLQLFISCFSKVFQFLLFRTIDTSW